MRIAEIFRSIQGEGVLTGVPSVFIRASGCNLRCVWCDTPYTSWRPEGAVQSVAEICAAVAAYAPTRHVVVTGGEPLIASDAPDLVRRLQGMGLHVTVETAGTVSSDTPADLMSISPKLSGSTPPGQPWAARHEERRLAPGVLAGLMALGPYQLKFVVGAPQELDEVDALVHALSADRERVLLMPEGRSVERLDEVSAWLTAACIERGYRFSDRLQVRLWGDTRGT